MESRGLSPVSGSERHAPVPVVRLDEAGAARAVAKHRQVLALDAQLMSFSPVSSAAGHSACQ
jgi:hypothetical protein